MKVFKGGSTHASKLNFSVLYNYKNNECAPRVVSYGVGVQSLLRSFLKPQAKRTVSIKNNFSKVKN